MGSGDGFPFEAHKGTAELIKVDEQWEGKEAMPLTLCEEPGYGGDKLSHPVTMMGEIKKCDLVMRFGTCMCFS